MARPESECDEVMSFARRAHRQHRQRCGRHRDGIAITQDDEVGPRGIFELLLFAPAIGQFDERRAGLSPTLVRRRNGFALG